MEVPIDKPSSGVSRSKILKSASVSEDVNKTMLQKEGEQIYGSADFVAKTSADFGCDRKFCRICGSCINVADCGFSQ